MMSFLLSNIGTRDIQFESNGELPAELYHNGQLIPRAAATYLLAHFGKVHEQIRLPMLERAVLYIRQRERSAPLKVVLFATDQPESTDPRFRNNDTVGFAELMRQLLMQRYQLARRDVLIRTTALKPADYDLMHLFYSEQLPDIARQVGSEDQVYLLTAGGTPQMNTMLLFVGAEVFGPRARPLYVSPDQPGAIPLDVTRQLYAQALRRNILVLLDTYAYSAALRLLSHEPDILPADQERMLRALLEAGEARRRFKIQQAAEALELAFVRARALREDLATLRAELNDASETALLRETIYLAQIAAETADWPDLLARLYRFSEGSLQLLAERLGVEWGSRERSSYKQSWWNANRALLAQIGLAQEIAPDKPAAENQQRAVDRANLRQVIAALSAASGAADMSQALDNLAIIDRPVALRNDYVHRFTPLAEEDIVARAQCSLADLLQAMRNTFAVIGQQVLLTPHPYEQINVICRHILAGEQ